MQHLKLTDHQTEQLIVKQFYQCPDYTHLVKEHYDSRFFSSEICECLIDIGIKYFSRYGRIVERPVMEYIIKRHTQSPNCKLEFSKIIAEFDTCMTMKIDDSNFIKDCIIDFFKNKSIWFAMTDNYQAIQEKKDVSPLIEMYHKIDSIALDTDMEYDYFRDKEKHLEELTKKDKKIRLGYAELDHRTNGGIPVDGKYLMVVMAQAGLGKSLLMSNLAVNFMKQNLFPMIITLEMPEKQYGHRIDAHITQMDINSIPRNIDIASRKINEFYELYPRSKLVIKDFPPRSISCNHIERFVKKYMRKGRKPDVLIVDYISLLNPIKSGQKDGSYDKVGNIAMELRRLSYIFEIPVIAPIQINRGGYNSNAITMDNIAESMVVAHTTDLLAALWQQDGDREANIMNISLLKQRNGWTGKPIKFNINYSNLTISDGAKPVQQSNIAKEKGNELIEDVNSL